MKTMMTNMHVKPTGNPDKDFVVMMIPHHKARSTWPRLSCNTEPIPKLRQLATDIVAAQEKEIAQMKAWLAKNSR